MNYTYTQEWCNISDAALKIEPVMGYYGHKTIRETYKQLIEELDNSRLEYELFSGDELRQAAESDGVLGKNVDAESIDIYYLAIADLLEQTVSVCGDLKPSRVMVNIVDYGESRLPITARGKRDVMSLIKLRVFEQIERTIRDLDKLLCQNWGALGREFKLHNPRVALRNLHYFCKDIVLSSARGWEGYHLSNANKAIWRALDVFDEMDESDEETLGDGFLDDLHTALTPLE